VRAITRLIKNAAEIVTSAERDDHSARILLRRSFELLPKREEAARRAEIAEFGERCG